MHRSPEAPEGLARVPSRRWSVRTFLIFLVLACLVPGMVGAGLMLLREYRHSRAQVERDTLQTARALVQTVDSYLLRAETAATSFSVSNALARGDLAEFHQTVREALAQGDLAVNVVLADRSGQQILNTLREFGEPLPRSGNPEFIEQVFATGKPIVSDLFIGGVLRSPIVAVGVPVTLKGQIVYVLSVNIQPDQFAGILQKQKLPGGRVASIIDRRGTIVGRTHHADKWVGQMASPTFLQHLRESPEGTLDIVSLDGVPVVSAYSVSPITKWGVAIGIPHETLEAELTRTFVLLALGLTGLFGLGLTLAWFMGGRIADSVQALKVPAGTLCGDRDSAIPPIHIQEAAEVAQALSEAARLLDERTAAIQASNQALAAKEEELRQAHRLGKFGHWHWDLRSGDVTASDSVREIYGRDIPSFPEQNGTLLTRESWQRVNEAAQEVVRTGRGYDLELEVNHGGGSSIWVNAKCEALRDAGGEVVALRGTVQDITERRQAEARSREQEKQFRQISESLPQLVWACDADGRADYLSPQWLAYTGLTPEQGRDGGWLESIHPDDRSRVAREWQSAIETGGIYDIEFRIRRRDGVYRWFRTRALPLWDDQGHLVKWFGTNTDIHDIKQMTEALLLTTERFQVALKNAAVIVFNQDLDLRYTWSYNPSLGFSSEDVIGKRDRDIFERRQDAERLEAIKREAIETGQGLRREVVVLHQSRFHTFDLVVEPLRDEEGRIVGITCAAIDVSERKAAEEALRQSKDRLRLALDAARMVAFQYDRASGRVVREGRTAQSLGLELEEQSSNFSHRVHPDDREGFLSVVNGLTFDHPDYQLEYRIGMPDGSYRWISDHARGTFDEAGRLASLQGVVVDITRDKEAALNLAHERELLSAIIDNIPVMLCLYDPGLQSFRVNRHFEAVLGWSLPEISRGGLLERAFPNPGERREVLDFMGRLTPGWREFDVTAKDGQRIPCEWANVALSDDSRVGIGIDVRERKAVQASLALHAERQALLLDVASSMLQGWDNKAEMARVIFEKIGGHLDADICFNYRVLPGGGEMELVAGLGLPAERRGEFQHLSVGEVFCGRAAVTAAGQIADQARICMDEQGRLVRRLGVGAYMVHPLLGPDGQVVGTLSLGSTRRERFEAEEAKLLQTIAYFLSLAWERRRAEQEIKRLNADLERRVEERTAELSAANRELEGFTFATSHDLRGPLGRINSFSTLLEQQYRDRLEGDGLVFLDFIRQNAARLMLLVDDLLNHARVAQQVPELQPIDIEAVARIILRENAEEIRGAGAEIRLALPPARVLADPHALNQAFGNLLQNALKYSAAARPPVIEIGGAEKGGRFRLWVRDNGIGFDMAYHDRIFEIFRRLHTYNEYEGSGVGLALVKRAMERMGGRVWAESEPGKGATFYLELQLA